VVVSLKEKMIDYKRFGTTLLMFAVFLFLGSILPKEGMSEVVKEYLTFATAGVLALSALFFALSRKYGKLIQDEE
jgi:hypothetical protein